MEAIIVEIKAWYKIVWDFLTDVFAKLELDTSGIPEWLAPEAE